MSKGHSLRCEISSTLSPDASYIAIKHLHSLLLWIDSKHYVAFVLLAVFMTWSNFRSRSSLLFLGVNPHMAIVIITRGQQSYRRAATTCRHDFRSQIQPQLHLHFPMHTISKGVLALCFSKSLITYIWLQISNQWPRLPMLPMPHLVDISPSPWDY